MLVYNTKSILATCCDKDGICFGDGTDDWCCGEQFYCSSNSLEYAEEKGGILCPSNVKKDIAFFMNIAGITIMLLFIIIFGVYLKKRE